MQLIDMNKSTEDHWATKKESAFLSKGNVIIYLQSKLRQYLTRQEEEYLKCLHITNVLRTQEPQLRLHRPSM